MKKVPADQIFLYYPRTGYSSWTYRNPSIQIRRGEEAGRSGVSQALYEILIEMELSPEMKGEYQFSVGKDKPSIMLGLMCTVLNT